MKIELIHPISHDGQEFDRGIHDIDESTAQLFLKSASHAAIPYAVPAKAKGKVSESADAGAGEEIRKKAEDLFNAGATVDEVVTELKISKRDAEKLRPVKE